jgi:hypothetical protein
MANQEAANQVCRAGAMLFRALQECSAQYDMIWADDATPLGTEEDRQQIAEKLAGATESLDLALAEFNA